VPYRHKSTREQALLLALVRARFSWWLPQAGPWTAAHVAPSIKGGCGPGYRTPLCSISPHIKRVRQIL